MATHPAGSDESLSLWIDTTPATHYPSLHGNVEADVAVVGAGITRPASGEIIVHTTGARCTHGNRALPQSRLMRQSAFRGTRVFTTERSENTEG